jgi:hypothetical protein
MKFRCYIILSALLATVSCTKEFDVKDTPDFVVTTETNTYKAGEPIKFQLQGSADIISFYSGEIYHDYAFKDGRQADVTGKGLTLSFKSGVAPGTPPGTQADQFSILTSTDFSGNYADLASVKAATWTDITDSFTLGTTAALVTSDTIDLSNFLVDGKPIYFALRYVNQPQVDSGFAQQWLIESFTLNSKDTLSNGAAITVADQVHSGFRIVDQYPIDAPARSQVTTTRVTLYGPAYKDPNDPIFDPNNPIYDPENPIYNPDSSAYIPTAVLPKFVPYDPNSSYNDPYSENWAVSAPISLDTVDLGKDWAVPVRSSVYAAKPAVFSYTYETPGTYKAYFVASNNTIDKSKEVVKEVDVTITP